MRKKKRGKTDILSASASSPDIPNGHSASDPDLEGNSSGTADHRSLLQPVKKDTKRAPRNQGANAQNASPKPKAKAKRAPSKKKTWPLQVCT